VFVHSHNLRRSRPNVAFIRDAPDNSVCSFRNTALNGKNISPGH
jgi:hypothetical protein